MINQNVHSTPLGWLGWAGLDLAGNQGLPYTPRQVGVGTQVVTVVAVGVVKVTVVQMSVPTQASYLPHPAASVDENGVLLASPRRHYQGVGGCRHTTESKMGNKGKQCLGEIHNRF